MCEVDEITLTNEEFVTTKTSNNRLFNNEVKCVYYSEGSRLGFIPNSLFETFPYLTILSLNSVQLTNLKPHYFKKAENLKGFFATKNVITTLEANLFVNALNLEEIFLKQNLITHVHRLTFSGLTKLVRIDLSLNKITNLNPYTFSYLVNLNLLRLKNNKCVNYDFNLGNYEALLELEESVKNNCSYDLTMDPPITTVRSTNESNKDCNDSFELLKKDIKANKIELLGAIHLLGDAINRLTVKLEENACEKNIDETVAKLEVKLDKSLKEIYDSLNKVEAQENN